MPEPLVVLHQNRLSVDHNLGLFTERLVDLFDCLDLVSETGVLGLRSEMLLFDGGDFVFVFAQEVLDLLVLLLPSCVVRLRQVVNRVLQLNNLRLTLHHGFLHQLRLLDQGLLQDRIRLKGVLVVGIAHFLRSSLQISKLLPRSCQVVLKSALTLLPIEGTSSDLLSKVVNHDLIVASLGCQLKQLGVQLLCLVADGCIVVGQLLDKHLKIVELLLVH